MTEKEKKKEKPKDKDKEKEKEEANASDSSDEDNTDYSYQFLRSDNQSFLLNVSFYLYNSKAIYLLYIIAEKPGDVYHLPLLSHVDLIS